ncbi:MAG: hypothetical protein JMDDDDMK_02577 [Acidobacteria bacterium]|nr:hypothetical protein [Acidobacteriota bacterium]
MMRQTRPRKRDAPSAPDSLHSKSFSGGAAKSINKRTVSAPKTLIISSGSTVFFFDFDIFSILPTVAGRSQNLHLPSLTS